MHVSIECGKCGEKIKTMKMLKSIKDEMSPHKNQCPACGARLITSEFSLDIQED